MIAGSKPFVGVKKGRIARSGLQAYTAKEFDEHGISLKGNKPVGYVYRPPEVLIKNKEKFANVLFVNDHAVEGVGPHNWRDKGIGFVGSDIGVEVDDDGVWLTADIVFYDTEAYELYKNGKVELSAQYDAMYAAMKDSKAAGYDFVMTDIPSVNHVALCNKARAGRGARISDSIDALGSIGGSLMGKARNGFLAFLGIGKKASDVKFSAVLMDSVAKMGTLDAAAVEKEVAHVMSHVTGLGESEAREFLVGAVSDCFQHPVEVLAKKDEVAAKVDALYEKCRVSDAEALRAILSDEDKAEAEKKAAEEKAAADKKAAEEKEAADKKTAAGVSDSVPFDIAKIVETAVAKATVGINDSIDAAVKKALGVNEPEKKTATTGQVLVSDSAGIDEDASYLVRGVFGNR